jgi:hypothetical protein
MAVLRRNAGRVSVGVLVVCALLAAWWALSPHPPRAVAEGRYDALDAVAAAQVDLLRRENGLDDDALAAMNLNDGQLEVVLAAARAWYETNVSALVAKWSGIADQRALIRHYRSQINMGQDMSNELEAAERQLAQLESAYETFVSGLRRTALAGLSDSQQAMSEHMRLRRELPMPFRVLDLSEAQDTGWQQARTRYLQRLAVTRDAQTRATIRGQYARHLETALGSGNMQTLATLRGYLGAASGRVVAVVQLVLPVETEG